MCPLSFRIEYRRSPSYRVALMLAVFCVIVGTFDTSAQGFDWEYSARMPKYASSTYAGLSVNVADDGQSTDLQVLEQAREGYPEIVCTSFERGRGSSFRFQLTGEYWRSSIMSMTLRAGYARRSSVFSGDSPRALLFDGSFLQTSYELSTNVHALNVEPSAKLCIPHSHVWGSVGVRAEFVVGSESRLTERVIEPGGYVFPGTTSRERSLADRDPAGLKAFVVNPVIAAGMDVNTGKDTYLSPSVVIALPVMSYGDRSTWTSLSVGFQLSFHFAVRGDSQ